METTTEKKARIRYRKQDNKLISIEPILSEKNGARYQVFIDLDTKTYVIRNMLTLKKFEGGEGINNLNVLKQKVKKHLKALGCKFDREKRMRTFGVCERGYNMQTHLSKLKEQRESK
jgi:hypothetical protein